MVGERVTAVPRTKPQKTLKDNRKCKGHSQRGFFKVGNHNIQRVTEPTSSTADDLLGLPASEDSALDCVR